MPTPWWQLDHEKALQAAAVLLQDRHRGMSYLRLIKELYLADRESLKRTGHPITFDRAVAMKHGPVLSGVYNIIKGEHLASTHWFQFVEVDGYQVRLMSSPGRSRLSRLDVQVLTEVMHEYRDLNDWELVERLHTELPEWRRNFADPTTSTPIPIEHIIESVGLGEHTEEILREISLLRQ